MSDQPKSLNRLMWWVVFGIATVTFSEFLRTFKDFTLTPTLGNGLELLAVILGLTLAVLVLLYDSYVQEKAKGNVHHPFRLFEWVYARQCAGRSNGGADACHKP